jgi:SOS response regulatory protein OraA/RecX
LPNEITEQTLDQIYEGDAEEELIDRALAKRLRLKGAPATPEAAKKLFDYLMRRGFGYDLVRRKVREAGKGVDASEEEAQLDDA